MIDPYKLRRVLAKIADALVFMIIGAWLLTQYLDSRHPGSDPSLRDIDDFLFAAYFVCLLIGIHLRPREDKADLNLREPSPRWSGTFVVLATGGAAAVIVGTIGVATEDYWGPAIIVLGTIVAAMVVWRFATRHAKNIGEARFTK